MKELCCTEREKELWRERSSEGWSKNEHFGPASTADLPIKQCWVNDPSQRHREQTTAQGSTVWISDSLILTKWIGYFFSFQNCEVFCSAAIDNWNWVCVGVILLFVLYMKFIWQILYNSLGFLNPFFFRKSKISSIQTPNIKNICIIFKLYTNISYN